MKVYTKNGKFRAKCAATRHSRVAAYPIDVRFKIKDGLWVQKRKDIDQPWSPWQPLHYPEVYYGSLIEKLDILYREWKYEEGKCEYQNQQKPPCAL